MVAKKLPISEIDYDGYCHLQEPLSTAERTYDMPDLKQRILEIIAEPHLASFATLTLEMKPWVRYVIAVGDDDLTIRFASYVDSRKIEQIRANPEVHMTSGVSGLADMNPYLQIQATATFSTNHHDRHGFWNEKLRSIFAGPDDPLYCVVIISPYRIEYCRQGPYEPDVWIKI